MRVGTWIAASLLFLFADWAFADTLDEIRKRGEMVIGMEAAYVPYESIQDGKIIGFDCDIGQHFADKLGVKVKFVDTEWSGIIPALYTKKFDTILSGMTITKDVNGGVRVNIDPAMIKRIKEQGVFSVAPVIIRITPMSQAQLSPLLGL